jgi:hypothetical protein
MGTIAEYLAGILAARRGVDVRQHIHDGIQQCYSDAIVGLPGPAGPEGPQGEVGPAGDQGPRGYGISGITRTAGVGTPGTYDTYTIEIEGGATSQFQVYNGLDAGDTELITARDFTIGNTTRSFNGSANVAWSLADIGAAHEMHDHGWLNAKLFVCSDGQYVKGDGVHDDRSGIQAAFDAAIVQNRPLYIPPGTYLIDTAFAEDPGAGIYLNFTGENQNLIVFGAGRGVTILKQGDGVVDEHGKWTRLVQMYMTESKAYGHIMFSDITFDKNARGNPGLTYYTGENATMLCFYNKINDAITSTIESLVIQRCQFHDKIGGAINMSLKKNIIIKHIVIDDITTTGWRDTNVHMERGDVEITCLTEDFSITNSSIRYMQIEPVAPSTDDYGPDQNYQRAFKIANCQINRLELYERPSPVNGDSEYVWLSKAFITNSIIKSFYVARMSTFVVNSAITFYDNSIFPGNLNVLNSYVYFTYFSATNSINSIYPRPDYLAKQRLTFTACHFRIENEWDQRAPINPVFKFAMGSTDKYAVFLRLVDCDFDSRFASIVDNSLAGNVHISGCRIACRGIPFKTGASGANTSALYLENNDYAAISGDLMEIVDSNSLWEVHFLGDIDIAKYRIIGTVTRPQNVKTKPKMAYGSTPSGLNRQFFKGEVVYTTNPAANGFIGWICVSAGTPGTWKTFGQISA